ncbi:MAG: hypothetical protein KA275_03025 [Chitinophagaceae bacterium]|nr:hypothetical protein [Chitinophagaceae bacterium]
MILETKANFKEIILNGGGLKFILVIVFLLFYTFYLNDFEFKNYNRITFGNIAGFIILVLTLITNANSATREIRLTETNIEYRNFLTPKWKLISLDTISHFCYFEKPIERYELFPKLVLVKKGWDKKEIKVNVNFSKHKTFNLLSQLHKQGFKVLLFEELINVEESDYYVP